MEDRLLHGEGDLEGEPFRLLPHLERLTWRWFELRCLADPECAAQDHSEDDDVDHGLAYTHRDGLVGYPKGNAKTEWEQALVLDHLEGPSLKLGTPVVTVGAVDGDQADELIRRAGMMLPEGSELAERLEVVTGRIRQRGRNGEARSATAALGKNDGKLTSLQLWDELHEVDGKGIGPDGARRHGILERAINKRAIGRQLAVSTAGWSLESLCGAKFTYGLKVASGEVADPGFLFEWWCATAGNLEDLALDDLDLSAEADQSRLRALIVEANPIAEVGGRPFVDNLVRAFEQHRLRGKLGDFARYHLNLWVPLLENLWMDMGAWAAREKSRPLPKAGARVVLGFDGSLTGDSTAIVGCTVERKPHLFVVDCWERPEGATEWEVPVQAVEDRLEAACTYWKVESVQADATYWRGSLQRLASRGVPVEEVPQSAQRMAPAASRLYEATTRDMVTHDGDPRLTRHVGNAYRVETVHGVRIEKEHANSSRRIDLALAACLAYTTAAQLALAKPKRTYAY